ncbi:magnetosome protein MamD [Paramagnetospirillum magneticum]|uniref:Magnetosome protein MamD n=1 Tax=Paramagnetospirillum magneticum (strain ATCC 700264 / AMB-1) TaxID=342108 RepID=Q2WAC1_PARM1|nr:magnetosome protein MamD [Paramagnetospirillum magneticum]BAE49204.1 hypothetical protein amb0400 [Paramagnetospirillum magneticum AMB-1]
MLDQVIMAKVEGTTQAALLSSMTGNSYTVGQVTAAGNGMGHWLFLNPADAAAAGKGAVALKLEGARQVAQLSSMVGNTVTIGNAPMVAGGASKWLVMLPKAGLAAKGAAAAAVGAGGAAVAAAQGGGNAGMVMMQLEGANQAFQLPMITGKTFTVAKTTAVGNEAANWLFLQPVGDTANTIKDLVVVKVQHGAGQVQWLVGKTFTIGESPIMAGTTNKFLVLNPVTGAAAKGAAGSAVAAKGAMQTVAFQAAGKTAVAGTAAKGAAAGAAASAAGKTAAVGTLWTGTGMSLGLGLGLGAAGPVILGGLIAAAGYGIYRYRKNQAASMATEVDEAISDAVTA